MPNHLIKQFITTISSESISGQEIFNRTKCYVGTFNIHDEAEIISMIMDVVGSGKGVVVDG